MGCEAVMRRCHGAVWPKALADLLPKLWNPSLAAGLEALARKHQKWGCGITVP